MLGASDLVVGRGGVALLEGLSLAVGTGDLLAVRGPNGAGKTTLLRTLAGLQPALSGSVDVAPDTLAYASHADGIKPSLTVRENLIFWADVFAAPDGIAPAVAAFDLEPLLERLAGRLSAGQKRRLGLARLMVTGRPLWLMDEPTVSLDSSAVAALAALLQAHLAGGGAAIIATHLDLGIEGQVLDVTPHRAQGRTAPRGFDEAFA